MDEKWFKINDRMINPAHIVDIDLSDDVVEITLSALEGEFDYAGSMGPKVLTYTGHQAEVLRPWLAEMLLCEGRSIQLLSEVSDTCALDTCDALVENDGEFCSSACHELYFEGELTITTILEDDEAQTSQTRYVCFLDVCNVHVGCNGNFCSDECAELFQEQIPF